MNTPNNYIDHSRDDSYIISKQNPTGECYFVNGRYSRIIKCKSRIFHMNGEVEWKIITTEPLSP